MVARLMLSGLLLICFAPAAVGQDDVVTRRKAAERYAEVADVHKMIADMTWNMAQTMPPPERDNFLRIMVQYVRIDALKEMMLVALEKHFTTKELNAMADFYGSPEGRSILQKFGAYMVDVMPGMQAEMKRAMQEYERAVRNKPKAKPAGA